MVGGRGFASEKKCPRRNVEPRVLAQAMVEHDDVERVQQLPFVFVDALDLRVENAVGINPRQPQPLDEPQLGLMFRGDDCGAKRFVIGERFQLFQLREVGDPAIADGLGYDGRQRRIGQQQPAARRNAVGFVVEAFREHGREVRHDALLEQFRMQRGHAVGAVRADDGQVRHADLPIRALFDEATARDAAFVARILRADIVEEAAVDLVNDFEMARQEVFEPLHRPFLQRFRQQRVIRVSQRALRELPRVVPVQLRLVQQQPHQFGHGQSRMCVVELDGGLVGQCGPIVAGSAKTADKIGE